MKKHNINYDIQCSYDDQVRNSLYDKYVPHKLTYEDIDTATKHYWYGADLPSVEHSPLSGNRTR